MIPAGHEHAMRPVARSPRPDGSEAIHSRCEAATGATSAAPGATVVERGCGLEEVREFGADGRPTRLRYRIAGVWLEPLDLLRLRLPVEECPRCKGARTLEPCPACVGVGVVEDGGPIRRPDLTVA